MLNGLKLETIATSASVEFNGHYFDTIYYGRVACYENGKRLWANRSAIKRLSRGDAMADAAQLAHDLQITRFFNESAR